MAHDMPAPGTNAGSLGFSGLQRDVVDRKALRLALGIRWGRSTTGSLAIRCTT